MYTSISETIRRMGMNLLRMLAVSQDDNSVYPITQTILNTYSSSSWSIDAPIWGEFSIPETRKRINSEETESVQTQPSGVLFLKTGRKPQTQVVLLDTEQKNIPIITVGGIKPSISNPIFYHCEYHQSTMGCHMTYTLVMSSSPTKATGQMSTVHPLYNDSVVSFHLISQRQR